MMKTIRLISTLMAVIISSQMMAVEISSIRFSKTDQLARLVIDTNEPLVVIETWPSNQMLLLIDKISKPVDDSLISVDAINFGIQVVYSADKKQAEILLPINKKNLIRRFKMDRTDQMPYRMVIDWSIDNSIDRSAGSEAIESIAPVVEVSIVLTVDESLRKQAENALTAGEYRQAIKLLTELLNSNSVEDKPFALEFIGVARERNYQLAFAKQYYQRFLAEYPDSEHAARVEQRLNAIIGIQNITQSKTLKGGSKKVRGKKSYTRGSISGDYRKGELVNDLGERRETISLASIDFDLRGFYQYEDSSLQVRFSAGHYEDLREEGDATNDRLRYANVAWKSNDNTYSVDFGRQRSRGKGIFGRFDGVVVGYGVTDDQKVSVTAGYPVASSRILSIDSERSFLGISYDWDDIYDGFDISLFAINQAIVDLTDRQAIGGEFKYLNQNVTFYGLVDYDIFFDELNALLISGSYTTDEKMRYHWSLNKRKSPYISTRNALVGQSSDSLEELQDFYLTEEEILDLAVDRTLESTTASFSISKPLNETFDISTNLTWMDISGAPESGGVAEIIDSDASVYMNLYLGARKLYSEGDSNQLGVRVSNLATSDVWSIFANSQYRITKQWKIRGKVRYDDRTSDNGSEQQSISPGIRLQYQDRSNYFYTELGAIFYTNQSQDFPEVSKDIYYLYLGYRYYF